MNQCQKLVADMMRLSNFNNFDGDTVVDSLEANADLWSGFVWGDVSRETGYVLRDIGDNWFNCDTLYILAKGKEEAKKLQKLGECWGADESNILDQRTASLMLGSYGSEHFVVRVWWD